MTCAEADHRLVGRRSLLSALDVALDSASRGSRSLVVLQGEPGQGKTSVLDALVARRREAGGRAVTMRGRAPDTTIPYAALHALLLEHSELLEQAGNPSARLLHTVLTRYQPPDSALAMGAAITSWFDCLAPDGQLLVAIDDADLLDENSLRILTYAASRDRPGRTAVVMSATRQVSLLRRVGAHQLQLHDLATVDSQDLIQHLQPPVSARGRLIGRLGGNPLALSFASHDLSSRRWAASEDLPMPARLLDHVEDVLAEMAGPVRHLVEVAAVTGEVQMDRLSTLCGFTQHGYTGDLVREAEDAGLLDGDVTRIQWRRPWLAEAIKQKCPSGRRQRLRHAVQQSAYPGTSMPSTADAVGRAPEAGSPLTPAERRVASSLLSGATARQVARELVLSEKTVDAHVQNIYRKLGVRSRSQLVLALMGPHADGEAVPGRLGARPGSAAAR